MRAFHGFCLHLTRAGAIFGATLTGLLSAMLVLEVALNAIFRVSQPWATEYAGYFLCASLFAGSGWALTEASHIRVTLLTERLPTWLERTLAAVTAAIGLGIATYAAWFLTQYALTSFGRGTTSLYPSRTPLWIPQGLLALSLWLLCVGIIARLLEILGLAESEVHALDPLTEI